MFHLISPTRYSQCSSGFLCSAWYCNLWLLQLSTDATCLLQPQDVFTCHYADMFLDCDNMIRSLYVAYLLRQLVCSFDRDHSGRLEQNSGQMMQLCYMSYLKLFLDDSSKARKESSCNKLLFSSLSYFSEQISPNFPQSWQTNYALCTHISLCVHLCTWRSKYPN